MTTVTEVITVTIVTNVTVVIMTNVTIGDGCDFYDRSDYCDNID